MATPLALSRIAAQQIGKLSGELEARILTEVLDTISKFANECPDREELVKVVNTRNNLIVSVRSLERRVSKFTTLTNKLRPAIFAAQTVIRLLKTNPAFCAVIPPSGGVGVPIGYLTTLSGKLREAEELLEALEGDLRSITILINSVTSDITDTLSLLDSLDLNITQCTEQLEDPEEIRKLIIQVQPRENTGSEGIPNENFTYRSQKGKDYILEVIYDNLKGVDIPRRVAVAKTLDGIIILRGQPSFSSSTQVLLDEVKFRIENQLP